MLSKPRPRPRFRLLALIRVTALLGLCLLVSLAALLRAAQASAGDVLVQIGRQLMRLPDAHYGGGVRQLWVNGMSLMLQSGESNKPPAEVVAEFRAACKAHAAMQLDERARSEVEYLGDMPWFQNVLDGVFVQNENDGSTVACIDTMGKPWDPLSIADAAQRFGKTGELLELGQLRYAWVRRTPVGSVFLNFWTEGPARLLEQFPRDTDAPGVDFPEVARVSGSQRYLSARLADSLLVMYVHRERSLEQLEVEYRSALAVGGYTVLDRVARGKGQASFAFEKGPRHAQLSLAAQKDRTLVTLLSQP
jgi:hypothetical protein